MPAVFIHDFYIMVILSAFVFQTFPKCNNKSQIHEKTMRNHQFYIFDSLTTEAEDSYAAFLHAVKETIDCGAIKTAFKKMSWRVRLSAGFIPSFGCVGHNTIIKSFSEF